MKKAKKHFSIHYSLVTSPRGFTLIEVLLAVVLMVGIIIAMGLFGRNVFDFGLDFTEKFGSQQAIQKTVNFMIPEIRSMEPSDIGGYPIVAAASSSLTFYTDVDVNGVVDRVRYFLEGTVLRKGIIVPSGNPPVYDPNNEVVIDTITSMVVSTSTIFSYYDSAYSGTQTPMSDPPTIADIRVIEVNLRAREDTQNTPTTFNVRITPRNVRSNL